jgi:hypothetical protein
MKHIATKMHWFHSLVGKTLFIKLVDTLDQLEDMGTKPLAEDLFKKLWERIMGWQGDFPPPPLPLVNPTTLTTKGVWDYGYCTVAIWQCGISAVVVRRLQYTKGIFDQRVTHLTTTLKDWPLSGNISVPTIVFNDHDLLMTVNRSAMYKYL